MTVSDEKLVAFLDDALDPAETAEIAGALLQDADLAARLEALTVDLDGMRAGMDAVLKAAPDLSVPMSAPAPATPRWRWLAVAAAALFMAGLATGWALRPADTTGWHQAVASYQVLYTEQTVTAVPLGDAQRDAGLAAVSARLGLKLTAESVEIEGLAFKRAQILEWNGAPLAQLVYLDEQGRPIALCLLRVDDGEAGMRAVNLSGMNAMTWHAGDFGAIMIGPVEDTAIRTFADRAQAGLRL